MFDIVNFALAAAVADNGTLTIGYPTGRSQHNYVSSTGKHKLFVGNNKYSAPADFTLTFNANASNITLTNKSGQSWPISSICAVEMERQGAGGVAVPTISQAILDNGRVIPGMPVLVDLGSPNVTDADGYFVSQDLTSAGVASVSVTVTAAIAAAALAGIADIPRNVVAAWTGTAVLTVTGKDEYGTVMKESSASSTSFTGKKAFKQITGIAVSANVTSLTVGTGVVLGLPVAIRNSAQILSETKNGVVMGRPTGKVRLPFYLDVADTSTGTAASAEFISPVSGVITLLATQVVVAISTGGAVTGKIGTTDIAGLSITVANSATKGTSQTDAPTAGDASTVVTKGDRIQVLAADAFTGGGALAGYIEITPTTGTSDGTLVTADATEATATTGDVRGTYAPFDTPDGSLGFKLLTVLPDPADLGVAQYAG